MLPDLLRTCPLLWCLAATVPASDALTIEGSSTVYPITEAIAEAWAATGHLRPAVAQNGSGAGITQLLAGQIAIADASRCIQAAELAKAQARGIGIIELPIACDGITVVVNAHNQFISELTVDELRALWQPHSTIRTWADLRPGWPAERIVFYASGGNSGTREFFTKAITHSDMALRDDCATDENFSVLIQGVIGNPNAITFCGWAYYQNNASMVRAIPVDAGKGPIAASKSAIIEGTYQPLSRPLFIYVRQDALATPAVRDFLAFYLAQVPHVAEEVGYVALTPQAYALVKDRLTSQHTGSAFVHAAPGAPILQTLQAATQAADAPAPVASASASAPTSAAATPPRAGSEEVRALIAHLRDRSLELARASMDDGSSLDDLARAARAAQEAETALANAVASSAHGGATTLAEVSQEGHR